MSSQTVTVPAGFRIDYHDPTHTYKIDGEPVPSVSTVLGVLDKPALVWWGMKIGTSGVEELYSRGKLRVYRKRLEVLWQPDPKDVERAAKALCKEAGKKWKELDSDATAAFFAKAIARGSALCPHWEPATMESMVEALTREKLTTNHVRDARGDHGTNAHKMFEAWAQMGILPDPDQVEDNPEERGRVEALLKFCEDAADSRAKKTEVIVGSKIHRVAGRYDFECELVGDLVTSLSPLKTRRFDGEPCLLDVKTSKAVYETHYLQLEGYEGLRRECGYPETKYRIVIHLKPSGNYRLHRSMRTFEEFVAVRPAHDVVKKAGTRW